MVCHSVIILLLCAVWSLFQDFSNAKVITAAEKCILKPGQIQRSFVTAFMRNIVVGPETTFQLYLVTCNKAATVTVTVPQPFFNKTIYIDQDSSSLVTLDYTYMITEKDVTSKVILVTSDVAISVFAFNTFKHSADAMTCLPQEDLGTEYYIINPEKSQDSDTNKQFAVANGFEDEVQVHITVSGSITYNGISYKTRDSFTLPLGNQQIIQFQSSDDLTGTKISSSAPVAVFSGHYCFTGVNSYCDILVEQLHPVKNWGNIFAVFPFFAHTQDVISLVAGSPDTLVIIESPESTTQQILQEGDHVRVTVDKILLINASKPIMVSYLFQESRTTDLEYQYDPFITIVPPSLLGRKYYKFVTQSYYDNFILIVSQASSDSDLYLDGKPLSSYPRTMKEFNQFRGWQVTLGKAEGQHEIYHKTSTFTLYVFGTAYIASYGYSIGQEQTQEPECSIRCLPDVAEYILPYSLVSEAHLDVLDIHLKDPLCQAEKEKNHYLIRIPYKRCGSNVLYEDGRTFYANTIYGTIPDTDVHRIEIPVRCEMESNKTVKVTINPKVKNVICKGYYNVSMKLYQSDSFTEVVTLYPHEVDLHSNLHLELEIESEDEGLQIFLETLTASPSLEVTNKKYTVVQDGCYQDLTIQEYILSDQRRHRLSFHAFKFDHFHAVYLTANVIICHNATSPNRCTQGCITLRRKRDVRSLKNKLETATLSQGPIVLKSREQSKHSELYIPPSIFVAIICVISILAVGLVFQTIYYKRRQNIFLQNRSN